MTKDSSFTIQDTLTLPRCGHRFATLTATKGFFDTGAIRLRSWLREVPFWKWLIFWVRFYTISTWILIPSGFSTLVAFNTFSELVFWSFLPFCVSVYGNLPSEGQLADWEFSVSQHSAVPQGVLVFPLSRLLLRGTNIFGYFVSF